MKKTFSLFIFLVLFDSSFALSPLPKNSYLRLGDNQREVKILQEILNSDPDTQVDKTGAGSPGKENWYFGRMTESALKRFQEKNNLEVTGRIDFKTWKTLNNYVTGTEKITPQTNTNIQSKIQSANEKRISINEQNKKDFEEAKKLAAEKKLADSETKKEESKSYIQSLLDKYTGFFYTNKGDAENDKQKTVVASSTQDTYSNNYSSQTPYLNPNTGIYSSNPAAAQQQPQQPINNNLAGQPGLNPFLPQQQNPYVSYGQLPGTGVPGEPFSTSRWGGTGGGDGFGQVVTTVYGHMRNGGSDGLDNGITACGQNSRLGGNGAKAISLKRSLRVSIFGNVTKSGWCGKEIEIKNPRTGKCGVYPLLEEGPQEHLQAAMDMTGTVWNELDPERRDGSKNTFQFRVLKAGDAGCGK